MLSCSCAVSFFFSSRRRHTRWNCDWSSDVCSSDLMYAAVESRGREIATLRALGYGGVPIALSVLLDRKSTRLNSSHSSISYAVFCLKKKKKKKQINRSTKSSLTECHSPRSRSFSTT